MNLHIMSWQDPEAANEAARYASPIPSRLLIGQILAEHPRSHSELVQHFSLDDPDAIEALSRRLNAMVRDSQLVANDEHPPRYRPLEDQDLIRGTVQAHAKGFGFILVDGMPDLFLPEREMRQVFDGDVVRARATRSDQRGRLVARIVDVVSHPQSEFIGQVKLIDGEYYIQLGSPHSHQPIAMEPEQITAAGLSVGDSARVKIDEWPSREEYANGHIVQSLADRAETQLIIPSTLLDFDLPHVFSDEVLSETAKYKEPTTRDRKDRVDLRDLALVTIDGADARDFDDAVYAEKRAGGGFRLVVAIADVSHYVKIGTALDDEAQARGTSVYFPNHVVPMLPEALSNGLCSLKPNVDRLCMVCDMTLSRAGRVTGYQFYPAVMHSKARLIYDQVADYLAGNQQAIPNEPAVHKSLQVLFQLYQVMLGVRAERGAMEFETTETYMLFDVLGGITEIKPRTRNDAHKLIEECMLLANVSAADYALKHKLPVLYRNHEPPEATRVQKVRDYVRLLGLTFPEQPTQTDYQAVIAATADRPDAASIHAVLLRSMMQAFYGADNLGHFGLAYEAYGHFTSPIRRYPDLLLHRAIKAQLAGRPQPLDADQLDAAGLHYSMTERRAEEASRSVTSWLKCHYMQQHLGEEFEGTITAVTEFGVFVTLNALYVDGLVHVRNMGNDFFEFDQSSQSLNGRGHGQRFALGDQLQVKIAGVNLDDRKVDFELVRQLTSAGRAVRQKAPRTQAAAGRSRAMRGQTPTPKAEASQAALIEQALETIKVKKPKTKKPKAEKDPKPKKSPNKKSKKVKAKKANAKKKAE
ncbi:MAG: ribonuclease R [Pseudomonadota bacterium]|nr:ribonuclease R [Pseudomonadota bacterium]